MVQNFRFKLLILFLFISLFPKSLFSLIRDVVESVKIIKVNSIEQEVKNFNIFILKGDVEILIDEALHIWADKVVINKENQTLVAQKETACVVIESQDLLILADSFFLNIYNKTARAENLRVHIPEGYIFAKSAKKEDSYNWVMRDITFTPCDQDIPHWSIVANSAVLYKNYLLKITGLFFKAGPIPFFMLPYLALPLQKRSKSGFLLPRLSYDNDLGLGLRQEFYWSIASGCDSTLGFDWRENKGIALIDEFRWARSEESFTLLNLRYALEKNAFVKKKDRIEKDTDRRYWIDGKDFRSLKGIFNKKIDSLIRVDFGTDKKIGYQFFDNFLKVDDTFYNSVILRHINKSNILNFYFDGFQTQKSKFSELNKFYRNGLIKDLDQEEVNEKKIFQKEVEDSVDVFVFPHFSLSSAFYKLNKNIDFRHHFFIDHIFSRKKKQDKFYLNSRVVKEDGVFSLDKADTFRFFYNFDMQANLKLKEQIFLFSLEPNFQLRTNLKNSNVKAKKNAIEGSFFENGRYRVFSKGSIEWVMPELFFEDNKEYNYFLQPTLKWEFLPKFKQDHWYYSDKWDRYYATNKLFFNLRNNWNVDQVFIDLNIYQGLDFYNKSDRFYLERTPGQKHLSPLNVELGVDCDVLDVFIKQEYEWKALQLLSTELNFSFNLNKFQLYLSSFYQHEKLQKERKLFSDISNFLALSFSMPLIKNTALNYSGQFYSTKKFSLFPFEGIRPLQHSINLTYHGHCWSISLGYEENRYKEYGYWKNDKAYTLFLKLESLGSFARKFKRPPVFSKY